MGYLIKFYALRKKSEVIKFNIPKFEIVIKKTSKGQFNKSRNPNPLKILIFRAEAEYCDHRDQHKSLIKDYIEMK